MGRLSELGFQFSRHTAAVVGGVIILAVVVMAVMAGVIFEHGPWDLVARPLLRPGYDPRYPLGTDMLGRDVMAGIFYGAQISLLIGIVATSVAIGLGAAIGAVAGYYGSWVDDALMRFTEVFQTIPPFLFMVVIVAIFQPSVTTIVLAIGAVSWPQVARLVRGEFMALRDREFIQAAIGIGMSDTRIIATQMLPNALSQIIVMASFIVAQTILNETGLAFLGLGDPNVISWGSMIGSGREAFRNAEYLTIIPGIAIVLTVLALNLIGDGLNDALNPRQRQR